MHVRDYTKGHPTIAANNHPVRHGAVVGIHNGIIFNDEELLGRARDRARRPGDERRLRGDLRAGRALRLDRAGLRAAARLDGDRLARRARARAALRRARRRPPALARPRPQRALLRLDPRRARGRRAYARHSLRKSQLARGQDPRGARRRGRRTERFSPDRSFTEQSLPSVRAPHEGAKSLQRLYAIAGVAA